MSIPKEPRQLMINLMYLVLTALLALNVSAEILNAFLTMDDSINASNAIAAESNSKIIAALEKQAEAYSQYEPLVTKAEEANNIVNEFFTYVGELKENLIAESGGIGEDGLPVGKKNKDITTRILIDERVAYDLEEKINAVRISLLSLIDEEKSRIGLERNIPLNVSPIPEGSDKKDWAEFNFFQMPVAAVLPLLSKFQNDAKIAETALLNFFLAKAGMEEIKPDSFEAVISADKSYVINGEQLNAEIFLGAYSSTADNIEVFVEGRKIPVRNGKAIFTTNANGLGGKEFEALIKVTNPITKKVESFRKKFHYEVGERSVTASADKMNVFYIGVQNPLSISAAGVPTEQLQVAAPNLNLTKISNGKYMVKPTRPGMTKVTVSGGGLDATTFEYRVKRIPNPVVKLGTRTLGSMSPGEMKIYDRLTPVLENFDFDARCHVVGFEIARLPKGDDVQVNENQGGKFTAATKRITNRATFGDTFYFDKIKVKCPGDEASRKIGGLIFHIR